VLICDLTHSLCVYDVWTLTPFYDWLCQSQAVVVASAPRRWGQVAATTWLGAGTMPLVPPEVESCYEPPRPPIPMLPHAPSDVDCHAPTRLLTAPCSLPSSPSRSSSAHSSSTATANVRPIGAIKHCPTRALNQRWPPKISG
jgi:hypothetical protein